MMWARPIITASVGVPVTQKRRSPSFLSRTGTVRVSEWPAPDCSSVGATIQTSSEKARAIVSSTLSPGALTPSSLVRRMRIAASYGRRGAERGNHPDGRRVHRREPAWSAEMQVPHNSVVLVADGRKSLFFRNEGDAEFPNLAVEEKEVHDNPAHHEQASDTAGHVDADDGRARRIDGGGRFPPAGGGPLRRRRPPRC